MITFITCFYIVKSKFDVNTYKNWIKNFITNVKNFNLVIYTDKESYYIFNDFIDTISNNPNIKIIIKPFTEFYNYKYKDYFIENQKRNRLLNYIDWKLVMLWTEKIHFVADAYSNQYFKTDWYGWCDIGYFRGRYNDIPINNISRWPNTEKFANLDIEKIYYARVNNDNKYFFTLLQNILKKNNYNLPLIPIPENQVSIAGGFFLVHYNKINWWKNTYDDKLSLYFQNNYLVKDDQIIIIDCIANNLKHFHLVQEFDPKYDNWFLFQRYLL